MRGGERGDADEGRRRRCFFSKGEESERSDGNVRLTSLWVDGFASAEILFFPT